MEYNVTSYFIDQHLTNGNADRIAILSKRGNYSYREMAAKVNQIANHLVSHGLKPEQRIILLLKDSPELIFFFMATLRIGAVAVLVNTYVKPDAFAQILKETRTQLLVTNHCYQDKLTLEANSTQIYVEDEKWLSESEAFSPVPVEADDTAFWLYTSGSTGTPKAAMHRCASMLMVAQNYGQQILDIGPEDRCLSTSKMFFAYGLGNSIIFPFSVGASCVVNDERYDMESISTFLKKYTPTIFFSVPGFYRQLLAASEIQAEIFDTVRICISAGEYLSAQIFNDWKNKIGQPIYDGIGSTESLHIFCSNSPKGYKQGTSGRPVPGYELKIVNEDGSEVTKGHEGILLVRGKTIAKGYWNKYEAGQKTFQGEWLATGDIYQEVDDGYFKYLGRQGDTFKCSGLWVSSSEIEETLMAYPEIGEAGVIGIVDADGVCAVKAFITPRQYDSQEAEALKYRIFQYLSQKLSKYKVPSAIEIFPELPKTATGKIARDQLRKVYQTEIRPS